VLLTSRAEEFCIVVEKFGGALPHQHFELTGEGAPAIERHAPSATLARTGCRDLLIYCEASNCSTLMNADHLPDDLPIRRSVREWCARGAATEARTCGRIGPSSKRVPQ